ncbi:MAG: hypothetical protein HKN09_13075 [Saprospiraceae bacterium]|nr:hypothetical protein [Saprospiraceae bacterium]
MITISVEILKPGIFSSIQDQGRDGLAFYAIPRGGASDLNSFHLANSLVGNDIHSPVIECVQMGLSLKFNGSCYFAICGSDFGWTLNSKSIPVNQLIHAEKHSVLACENSASMAKAYIAFGGSLKSSISYNSYATLPAYGWGGNQGKKLRKGDLLEIETESSKKLSTYPSLQFKIKPKSEIYFNPGPEWEVLDNAQKDLLFNKPFAITSESNRMGARLKGPALIHDIQLTYSVPVLPGFIQLLPSGQLIVVLEDGQTTGGYPRIGYLNRNQLNAFNQYLPNQSFRFVNR